MQPGDESSARRLRAGAPRLVTALVLVALAALALLLFERATAKYGLHVSPDSVRYAELADLLARDGLSVLFRDDNRYEGYLFSRDMVPITNRYTPPAYSLAIAAIQAACGCDPYQAMHLAHRGMFVTLPLLVFLAMRLGFRARTRAAIVAALASILGPSVAMGSRALSEAPFCLLVTALAWTTATYLRRPRVLLAVCAGAVVAVAYYVRATGVFLAPLPLATIALLAWRGRDGGMLLRHGGACAVAMCVPIGAWMLRNQVMLGIAAGEYPAQRSSFLGNCERAAAVIGHWFLPSASNGLAAIAGGATGLVAAVAVGAVWRMARHARDPRLADLAPWPGVLACLYLLGSLVSASVYRFDALNDRLLWPIHVPLLLSICAAMDAVAWRRVRPRVLSWIAAAVGLAMLIGAARVALRAAKHQARAGAGGWSSDKYVRTELYDWLAGNRSRLAGQRVFTNAPDELSFHHEIGSRFLPVSADAIEPVTVPSDSRHPIWSEDAFWIVWWNGVRTSYVTHPDALRETHALRELHASEAGTVWECRRIR